jgi:hypothetical protein
MEVDAVAKPGAKFTPGSREILRCAQMIGSACGILLQENDSGLTPADSPFVKPLQ